VTSDEYVMIWAGRFISWCSYVGIRAGRFAVTCSHLRAAVSGDVRSWWIRYVGLRAWRSIELDYGRGGS